VDGVAAALPTTIAGYDVVRMLGEGGHGRCYLARPPARLRLGGEPVVLKVFGDRVGEQAYERGVRALRAFAAVRSDRLVRAFDAVLEDSFGYAMAHFPLGSLAAPARPLSRADALAALEHAARAVHAVHEAGLAHGNLRPGNVLIAPDGPGTGGWLADPALARTLAPGTVLTGMRRASAVEFTDPDVLAGARPSRRSDVWSLGATVHRVLGGAGLHGELPDTQPLEVVRRILTVRPHVHPALEPGAAALVRHCVADGPARLTSAAAVADRLAALR
jgi:eukaryotic-like serine/threonine-protein kinase